MSTGNVAGIRRVPFHLPQLIEGMKRGAPIYVVEGEKDVLAIEAAGGVATCNPGGAGKWRDEFNAYFEGANVVVIADRDEPNSQGRRTGRDHAGDVRRHLEGVNASVTVVEAATGKDASDHLAEGFSLDEFVPVSESEHASTSEHADHTPGKRSLSLTPASAIQVRPIRWLWEGRFPVGSLCLLAGREGTTKSTHAYGFAARITRGTVPGVHFGTPKNVIIAATEDSWSQTIAPRLMAAGADLDRVFRIDVTTSEGVAGTLTLPTDTEALEAHLLDGETGLLLLDPLVSRLDAGLDTHKDAEVRRALEPIGAMADRTGVVVLGLIHLNKSTTADPLTQIMASRAFAAVPRAILVFARDPEDEARILVGQPKNNLGRIDLPTLAYRVEVVHVADTDEGPVTATRVVPDGESTTTIAEALDVNGGADRTATSDAAGWLADYMESVGGVAESKDVKAAAQQAGHARATLDRARVRLGITTESHGFPRRSYWRSSRSAVVSTPGESEFIEMIETTGMTVPPVDSVVSVNSVVSDPPGGEMTGTASP